MKKVTVRGERGLITVCVDKGDWLQDVASDLSAHDNLPGASPFCEVPVNNHYETHRLATTLAQRVTGEVCFDSESLAAMSRDFGGVAEYRPQVVVWPTNTDDVVAIIRTARETGSSLAVRGAGHSQGGQALNRGGIVVQTQRLNKIEYFSEDDGSVTAGAGMLWSDLVGAVIDHDLWPDVMTDNLKVTLGGTLAVGGVGPASFRQGAQIHRCLGLEVVLGTGDVVWLNAEHQARLFHHVLGGLGQFGVVTKVKLSLRSAAPFIHSHVLTYHDIGNLLADARQLMTRETVHLLSGFAVPVGRPTTGSNHQFVLAVSAEMDQMSSREKRQLVDGLSPNEQSEENLTTRDYLSRLDDTFEGYQRPTEKNLAHPWVEHFLPISNVPDYVEAVTADFPTDSLLLWPMQTESLRHPMLCLPESDAVMLVGIMCSLRHTDLAEVLPRLRNADKLGTALGGKRYLSGWLDFDAHRWRRHFGAVRWKEIISVKRQCDPDQLFRLWDLGSC